MSINSVLYGAIISVIIMIGVYFYAHNSGYDKGAKAEQDICQAFKDEQEKSIQQYKDQIQDFSNKLDQANLRNQTLSKQLDAVNNQELQHETSTPFYDLNIPSVSVRAYNQRIQSTRPPKAQ